MSGVAQSSLSLRVLLLAALASAVWLVQPFADALLVATVVAVLSWPFHQRMLARLRGRAALATALSIVGVSIGVVAPVIGLLWLVSVELVSLADQLATELESAQLSAQVTRLQGLPMVAWLIAQGGGPEALTEAVRSAAREGLTDVARSIGQSVPNLVGLTARAVLKATVFLLTLATLLFRGPELAHWVERLSPLPARHTTRLFQVFAEFARNVVLAGLVAATVQGAVAWLGYVIVGLDRPLLFAILTGVLAFVPLVGTAAAWVPIALLLMLQGKPGSALFVVFWSVVLTGTIDNLVKPLVVRGRSDMPTLLVFLGVFGGLIAFGVIGLLVGPVLMALLLALLRIYEESLEPASGA